MTELHRHLNQVPPPNDCASTKVTLSYLEACNKIFECGLLCHDKITKKDDQALVNIWDGYRFFEKWLDETYEQGS